MCWVTYGSSPLLRNERYTRKMADNVAVPRSFKCRHFTRRSGASDDRTSPYLGRWVILMSLGWQESSEVGQQWRRRWRNIDALSSRWRIRAERSALALSTSFNPSRTCRMVECLTEWRSISYASPRDDRFASHPVSLMCFCHYVHVLYDVLLLTDRYHRSFIATIISMQREGRSWTGE